MPKETRNPKPPKPEARVLLGRLGNIQEAHEGICHRQRGTDGKYRIAWSLWTRPLVVSVAPAGQM